MKILVLQLRRLGDTLMCTPLLRALAEGGASADVHICLERPYAPVVRGNPHVARTIVSDPGSPLDLWRVLRRERYDVVIDTLGTPGSARLSWLTGARVRIGRDRSWRRLFYTHRVAPAPGPRYSALGKLSFLEPLGIRSSDCRLELFPADEDRQEAARRWSELRRREDGRVVAFSPASRRERKRWPAERFAAVCDRWHRHHGVVFLPVFGPGEEDQIAAVQAAAHESAAFLDGSPPVPLASVAPLIGRCAFYFGNDSGLRHMAIAAGIPTIAVFGTTSPLSWTPPGVPGHACAGGGRPIESVSVDEVDALYARVTPWADQRERGMIAGQSISSGTVSPE